MADRELLELAAKAAGEITEIWYGNQAYFDGVLSRWNPLTDDGDALRLAVKLGLDVGFDFDRVDAASDFGFYTEYLYEKPEPTDPYAATRRVIVRAAAEIGKKGEQK